MSARMHVLVAIALAALIGVPSGAAAQEPRWALDFENGAVFTWYNDVRIPGNTGTLFSFNEDLTSDTEYFWRVRLDVRLGRKHVLSGLAAPLGIDASGTFDRPVAFAGETFAPGVPVTGRYVFNSYRFTYRYEFLDKGGWRFGIGVTAKVRDAVISLKTTSQYAEKPDLGVVPLVNFKLERDLGKKVVLPPRGRRARGAAGPRGGHLRRHSRAAEQARHAQGRVPDARGRRGQRRGLHLLRLPLRRRSARSSGSDAAARPGADVPAFRTCPPLRRWAAPVAWRRAGAAT